MSLNCPICAHSLITIPKNSLMLVMDGNLLFKCIGTVIHEFWSHPRGSYTSRGTRIYHYNSSGVSQTDFSFDRRWELESGGWEELPKEDPEPEKTKISFTIDSTGYSTDDFRKLIYSAEDHARKDGVSVAHVIAEALQAFLTTDN